MSDRWDKRGPLYIRSKRRAKNAPRDSIAFRLYWLLDKYNITPTEIARRGGPTRSYMSHIFNGERHVSYNQLVKISKAMPLTSAETQWLFLAEHYIAPAWEGKINVHITKEMPDRPDAHGD